MTDDRRRIEELEAKVEMLAAFSRWAAETIWRAPFYSTAHPPIPEAPKEPVA
jgi:hypothetical protein